MSGEQIAQIGRGIVYVAGPGSGRPRRPFPPRRATMVGVSETVARRVRVHGSVQGVFFRDTTRRRAESRGVAGWVRNCADGTVEALFEGDADAVESMVAFAREGPRGAYVDRVDVQDAEAEGLGRFEIR